MLYKNVFWFEILTHKCIRQNRDKTVLLTYDNVYWTQLVYLVNAHFTLTHHSYSNVQFYTLPLWGSFDYQVFNLMNTFSNQFRLPTSYGFCLLGEIHHHLYIPFLLFYDFLLTRWLVHYSNSPPFWRLSIHMEPKASLHCP